MIDTVMKELSLKETSGVESIKNSVSLFALDFIIHVDKTVTVFKDKGARRSTTPVNKQNWLDVSVGP